MLRDELSTKESKFDYSKEEFVKDIFKFLEEHKAEYDDKVLVRSAIVKSEKYNYWLNCLTLFKILKKEEFIPQKENIVYDIFALLEEVITLEKFKKIVEHLWGSMQICNFDIRFEGIQNFDMEYLYNRNVFCDWPGLYFEIGYHQNTPRPPDYPLVKYGIPCFSDGYEAMKEWLEIKNFHGRDDGRLGEILIFLPNYKVMIKEISYNEGTITVRVDGSKEKINKLECQIEVKTHNKTIRKNSIITNGNESFLFESIEEPMETYIQLVTPEGEKIDYYWENSFGHSGNVRFIRQQINKEVLHKIDNGENENVEFKPFIRIGDSKEKEIIEAIIAFANTEGGGILIGVSDYSEIVGIPKDIIENYKGHLRKIASDTISKGISLDFIEHNIGDKLILEIKVGEGKQKPYFDIRKNLTYIRRGSTNRHPNEEELKSLFTERIRV